MGSRQDTKNGWDFVPIRSLFYQSVFDFDAVQFFKHRLGGDEDEDYRRGCVDQIHRKAGHIVSFQHFRDVCGYVVG